MRNSIASLIAEMAAAPANSAQNELFCAGFSDLRRRLALHPSPVRASLVYEQAAEVANGVASQCLPLAMALVMHLYPLCALQCVPLPPLSRAARRRARLVRDIRRRGLILANAGSERVCGTNAAIGAVATPEGIRLDGEFGYVSLASVADLVMFEAPLVDGTGIAFCAADLRAKSARIGVARFRGRMQLSDTRTVSFVNHHVPHARCLVVAAESTALYCIRDYQRCWFHLLLAEIHLARIDALHRMRRFEPTGDDALQRDELACLREYCLRLIDAPFTPGHLQSLSRVSATLKLRVSRLAQATAGQLRAVDPAHGEDADELMYLGMQPTADARILRRLTDELARVRSVR